MEQRGQSISLRTLLPGRAGEGDASTISQRRISLRMRVGSTEIKAETTKLAYELDRQLLDNHFQWRSWTKETIPAPAARNDVPTFAGLCLAIEARFDARYPDTERPTEASGGASRSQRSSTSSTSAVLCTRRPSAGP